MSESSSSVVGLVLGSQDATPLEFWVGVREGGRLQLDDLVVTRTTLDDGDEVTFYGIVDIVRKRFEGSQFDTDAFRVADGTLPADVSYAAHVQVTRVEPEVFVPPSPGAPVDVVRGEEFRRALYFDRMERSVAIGLTRTGEAVHANLEFLDGTRGAHASISGVSGVATKTSYATFILYSLFHSGALGIDAANAKALIFNVKGEDLLWLDKKNAKLTPAIEAEYARLGLPAGPFQSVAFFAPARRGSDTPMPDTGSRQDGVQPYIWTMREFCRERLLRFVFVDGEDARAQIHLVISRVEQALERAAREGDQSTASVMVDGNAIASFSDLVDLLDGPSPGRDDAGRSGGRRHPGRVPSSPSRRGRAHGPPGERPLAGPQPHHRLERPAGDGGRHPLAALHGAAVRGRRAAEAHDGAEGAAGRLAPAGVRGAGRAQQVRAARGLEPAAQRAAGHRRARPLARRLAVRRAADRQRGGAPHRRERVAEGGGAPGCRGGRAQRVRLPHARRPRAGHAAAARLDDRRPTGDSDGHPAALPVPVVGDTRETKRPPAAVDRDPFARMDL